MNFNEAIRIFNANRGLRVKVGQINGQDRELRNFAIFMRNCEIEKVTDEHIVEWLNLFKTMGYTTGTLIKKEEALIQFYKFWQRKGLDVVDPMLIPLTDKEYVKPRVCTIESYKALLRVCEQSTKRNYMVRNKAMITLLWNTGMRIGELVSLNVKDVDIERRLITIKTEKSKGVRPFRTIPYDILDEEAVKVLPKWLEFREKMLKEKPIEDSEALFFGYKTTRIYGRRFTGQSLGEIFSRTSKEAGLAVEEYVNPHSMRHHFGHALAIKGVNNSVISEAMGHSAISSSFRYTQLESGDLTEVLRRK